MAKVRVLGPRDLLPDALRALQDLGVLHLSSAPLGEPVAGDVPGRREARRRRRLEAILADLDALLGVLAPSEAAAANPPPASAADLVRWMKLARRLRRTVDELLRRRGAIGEERALIEKYRQYVSLFEPIFRGAVELPNVAAFHLVLRAGERETVERLRASLATLVGEAFELRAEPLPSGELALLLLVAADAAKPAEKVLSAARVQEMPAPLGFGGGSLAAAIPRLKARLGEIPQELSAIRAELDRLARIHGAELVRARATLRDDLGRLAALPLCGATAHAFLIEGWLPVAERSRLEARLASECGASIVVRDLASEEGAPVVLTNPRFFRPFEVLVRLMPLPRYGSIDPTPFVGVFFPIFFGLIVGDVGYGALIALLGIVLHLRSEPGGVARDVAEVSGPCAAFSILFGFAFGELFGDLGRRWLGLRPLAFDREAGVTTFLLLAIAIGLVHVVLGLALGVVNERRHPRRAAGRALSILMLLLVTVALLAGFGAVPRAILAPSVVALFVLVPLLIRLEGFVGAIELLSMLGNVLSYARLMALGTASVMLAVVANRMAGAVGSVLVGAAFALLLHLVNLTLALFSPTIHALRLHYVEFFSKFYSAGGTPYRPFGRWTPQAGT